MYNSPEENFMYASFGIGCLLLFIAVIVVLIVSALANISTEGQVILSVMALISLIGWRNWSKKTKPARMLKRVLREREELHARIDSRTWWTIAVTIPDSVYGGSSSDAWSCTVNVYAENQGTAERKAMDLVRRRNHKYDDMRLEMNREFESGASDTYPEQELTFIIDGPFKVTNHGHSGGTPSFQKCDPHKFDQQIRQLEWAVKNKKY